MKHKSWHHLYDMISGHLTAITAAMYTNKLYGIKYVQMYHASNDICANNPFPVIYPDLTL